MSCYLHERERIDVMTSLPAEDGGEKKVLVQGCSALS